MMMGNMNFVFANIFLVFIYYSLFLGICNSTLDQQLHGTREQPHILLRFNSLLKHQSTQNASVRFIVHNGLYNV